MTDLSRIADDFEPEHDPNAEDPNDSVETWGKVFETYSTEHLQAIEAGAWPKGEKATLNQRKAANNVLKTRT